MAISSVSSTSSNLETLVQQYMQLERLSLNTYTTRYNTISTRKNQFESLKQQLVSLKDLAKTFVDDNGTSVFSTVTTSSSDKNILSVSADSSTAPGVYQLRVRQLATSTTLRSQNFLNTAASVKSKLQVVAGTQNLDISKSWTDQGFSGLAGSTVSFKTNAEWAEFTLSEGETIKAFFTRINNDVTAGVNIYYDGDSDRIVIESDEPGTTLNMKQSLENGFLNTMKIADETLGTVIGDTSSHSFDHNKSGVAATIKLYQANFDYALAKSDYGSFQINGITINWDADVDSLNDVIQRINASQANVTAFYDESLNKMVLTSNQSGSEAIQFEDLQGPGFLHDCLKLDADVQNLGQDARFTINSDQIEDEIVKTSNDFTINGLAVALNDISVANGNYLDPETRVITAKAVYDTGAVKRQINTFISRFNQTMDTLSSKVDVDPITYTRGVLVGETAVTRLRSELIRAAIEPMQALSSNSVRSLTDLGITIDSSMHLKFSDEDIFNDLLSSNLGAIQEFFGAEDGLGNYLVQTLESYTETSDGLIDQRKEILDDQMDFIKTQINREEARLQKKEESYRRELAAMQNMLTQIVQQQSMVTQILSSLQN